MLDAWCLDLQFFGSLVLGSWFLVLRFSGSRLSALFQIGRPVAQPARDSRLDRRNCGSFICAIHVERDLLPGRDKLTLVTSADISSLGLWIEQLVAESTGKEGKGIVPVAGEMLAPPESYGDDRVFVVVHTGQLDGETDAKLRELESAGHPVVRRVLDGKRVGIIGVRQINQLADLLLIVSCWLLVARRR